MALRESAHKPNRRALDIRDVHSRRHVRLGLRVSDWLRLQADLDRILPRAKLASSLSLIVPCYDVGEYIDDFFESVFTQSVDPTSLEIIAVDDGSTDDTAQRIRAWSRRLPNLKCIRQENAGLASARNAGLEAATGEWVSFPDPDDFLSRDYLERVDEELRQARQRSLAMVACNLVFYRESRARLADSHPLRYRFRNPRSALPADDLKDFMQLAANSAWLRRSDIDRFGFRFDPRIAPSFEDAHLINKLLIRVPEEEAVFLRAPTYYYRKRASQDSLIDRSKMDRRWYVDQLRYGVLDLLGDARSIRRKVPDFIQRTALYETYWRFRHIAEHPSELDTVLTKAEQAEFWHLLRGIFDHIDASTIENFDLEVFGNEYRAGLLALMKRRPPDPAPTAREIAQAFGMNPKA